MADPFAQLTERLRELPGVGPRQARRLSYWLARRESGWVEALATTLIAARASMRTCASCARLFAGSTDTCPLCSDTTRDHTLLLVVEKEVDLENIERTGVYRGRYFVLGGTMALFEQKPEYEARLTALTRTIEARARALPPLSEVIIALSATADGEDTAEYLREKIQPTLDTRGVKLSVLGRGLSTGTELEYVDTATLKSALSGRT